LPSLKYSHDDMSSGHIIDSEIHESPNQNRGKQFTLESMYVLHEIAKT